MIQLAKKPDPKRFEVSKSTLRFDMFMTHFIKVGGGGVVLAVFGIFFFILFQVIPLFQNASVEELQVVETGLSDFEVIGADEWGEYPFFAGLDGAIHFIDPTGERPMETIQPDFKKDLEFTSLRYSPREAAVLYGSADGQYAIAKIKYSPDFSNAEKRVIRAKVTAEKASGFGKPGFPIRAIDFYDGENARRIGGIQETDKGLEVFVEDYKRKASLFGPGKLKKTNSYNITGQIVGQPEKVLMSALGKSVVVTSDQGRIYYFEKDQGEYVMKQEILPFEGSEGEHKLESIDWLLGSVSLYVTSDKGKNIVLSPYRDEALGKLQYQEIQSLSPLPEGGDLFSPSLRNRGFLITSGKHVSIRYSTTGSVRWQSQLDFEPKAAALGLRYDRILFAEPDGTLHAYSLNDPHPESGLRAFFGKIWYEGQVEPKYLWQSTGGDSDFEPKLSMIPLIIGTLKGTFYALLFALPIAILAAIYTSQFLQPRYKKVVKPMMEIMASLPSVVLGFLAALWLAPLIEDRLPSVFCILILVPITAFCIGWLWGIMPLPIRRKIKPGEEFFVFIPILIIVGYSGWVLGPFVEHILFVVTDPSTGVSVVDFRLWWAETTELDFQQRNSMVVGFMMGFAVIPIIFTISEDAMTNVPRYLNSASLALGASRWQTTWRVILPTASPGIFSGLMIGLGRAVGETMIVVMATGNTAVTEWNIFNGFRAFSANIAVELPEAPVHSTLYRTLFLCALILFVMTFFVNTIAEITRHRLREKYKTVG